MTERPILFSGEMVRAILDGRKTQTRRIAKGIPSWDHLGKDIMDWDLSGVYQEDDGRWILEIQTDVDDSTREEIKCPYEIGMRLWVRETCMDLDRTGVEHRNEHGNLMRFAYRADCPAGSVGDSARKDYGLKWRPSIHMPRWASRITLEITSVRVERVQDISEEDAKAEGITDSFPEMECNSDRPFAEGFSNLWDSINAKRGFGWDKNPWVWVIEFRRV